MVCCVIVVTDTCLVLVSFFSLVWLLVSCFVLFGFWVVFLSCVCICVVLVCLVIFACCFGEYGYWWWGFLGLLFWVVGWFL